MSRNRRQRSTHANHERWLVSYADFITLLFAFFVVLYASAQVDNHKIAQVSAAIQGAFQQLGVFSGAAAPFVRADAPLLMARDPLQIRSGANAILKSATGLEGRGGGGGADVNALKKELESALGEEINKHEIQMHVTPEGLVVSLSEVGFFNSGEATLLPEGQATLTRIATVLNHHGFQIRVEGHTDNIPIHNSRYKSNWELSTERATEVVSILIERYGLDPTLVSAAGYAEYRPMADNRTEEGRKMNRRVDLVVVSRVYRESTASTGPSSAHGG